VFQGTLPGVLPDYTKSIFHHRQIIDGVKNGNAEAVGEIILANLKFGLDGILFKIKEKKKLRFKNESDRQ
jgi:hypothetical protein